MTAYRWHVVWLRQGQDGRLLPNVLHEGTVEAGSAWEAAMAAGAARNVEFRRRAEMGELLCQMSYRVEAVGA